MFEKPVEFTKEKIDQYLDELSKEYKKLGGRNCPVEIILIGGAAIIENYGFRNMTTDIDAIIPTIAIMKDAINHVGDKYNLPNGWLNADFMKTSSYSPRLFEFSKQYKTFNHILSVRYISGEYLIAMKLKSGREYKNDLSDIIGILAEHKRINQEITFEQINNAVNDLYGGMDALDATASSFIKAVLEQGDFEEMYSVIREKEINAKTILIEFENKYPGVLVDGNVNQVLDNLNQTSGDKQSILATLEKLKTDQETSQ